MTENELYTAMNKAGIDFEVVEIFEGARWLRIDVDETSQYKLDEMQSDTEPLIQVCFEPDEWDDLDEKRETLDYLATDLKRLNIDDNGLTAKALEQLASNGEFHEVNYFNALENLFNDAGYYTYNSDTWLEVYATTDEGGKEHENI